MHSLKRVMNHISNLTFAGCAVLVVLIYAPLHAQDRDETLADIRQDLSVLYYEVQKLKRELSTTGGANVPGASGTVLERVNLIDAELARLTALTEELEFRVNNVVTDGTRRIADLEFRLVELEGGDVSTLSETTTLGAIDLPNEAEQPAEDEGQEPQLAANEEVDFAAADEAMSNEDFAAAAEAFGQFAQNYPAGPLTIAALFKSGEAYRALKEDRLAAEKYLEAYRRNPKSDFAPAALTELGAALGRIGKKDAACALLRQAEVSFAQSEYAAQIQTEIGNLVCP